MQAPLLLLPVLCSVAIGQAPVQRDPNATPPRPQMHAAAASTLPADASPVRPTPPDQRAAMHAPSRERGTPPVPDVGAPGRIQLPEHVVFDRPQGDDVLWAIGEDWKARIDGRGCEFVPFFGAQAPQNFPVRLELVRATAGNATLTLADGRPERHGAQVRTVRGGVVEVLDTAMRQIEQSFVFADLPNRGAVAIEVGITGDYQTEVLPNGLRLRNAHGAVDYTKAIAYDAAGARIDLRIEWTGSAARIEIPATFVAAARLPLVLDPVVATNAGLAPGIPAASAQRNADVAKVGSSTCVVWTRTWSATDEDVVVQLLDAGLNPAGVAQYIDFTTQNWLGPKVAPNNFTQKFLCVAQVNLGATYWIDGRLIDTVGTLSATLDIERDGIAGHLPGNKFRPDVGGDPYLQPGAAYYTVVFEHEVTPGNHDVYYKQVNQDGSLRQVTPIALDTSSTNQSNPCIGAGNGLPSLSNRVMVAWQSASATTPFDENIWGAYVEWNGNLLIPAFQITTGTRNQRHPAVSSVAEVNGTACQLLAYEEDWVTDNDILTQVFDMNGTALASYDLSFGTANGAFYLRNQIAPSVDSDGTRFVVGYAEYSGTDHDTYLSTLAFLPNTASVRVDEDRVTVAATPNFDDFGPSVFAEYAANSVPNPYYLLGSVIVYANDIEVRRYGGYAPGTPFVRFASQCGTLPISGSGVPALGNNITFTLSTSSFFSGFVFGFPAYVGLGVCPCVLGVNSVADVPGPVYTWHVPNNPTFVNAFTLSIQGFAFGGSACLGAIDLSDTLDFQIR